MERLIAGARAAIAAGRFAAYRDAVLAGEPPAPDRATQPSVPIGPQVALATGATACCR